MCKQPPIPRVLVVDDNSSNASFVTRVLGNHDLEYRLATDGEQALLEAEKFSPAVVIMSVSVPNQDGWLVCYKLKMRTQPPRVVLTTLNLNEGARRFAEFVRADRLLGRPLSGDKLASAVHDMLASHEPSAAKYARSARGKDVADE